MRHASTHPPRVASATALRSRARRAGVLAAALAVGAVACLALPGHADVVEPEVLHGGVVTAFDVSSSGGAPVLRVRRGDASWAPADVVVRADGDRAEHLLPQRLPRRYAGLLEAGTTVYQLPGSGEGLPSLRWGTRDLASTWDGEQPLADTAATLELSASGPGRVVAFTDAGDAGDAARLDVHLDSAAAGTAAIELALGEEAAPTWVFSRPGSYTVHARPTLHRADGGAVVGAVSAYRVEVTAPTAPAQPAPTAPVDAAPPTPAPPAQQPSAPPAGAPAAQVQAQVQAQASSADATGRCAVAGLAADAQEATAGHFDLGVQVAQGRLLSRIKDDQTVPPTWRDPSSVLFRLGDTAATTVPSSTAHAFLGAPGSTVWTIGQSQSQGVPWLGWNTQHPSAVSAIEGATTWRLDSVDGPGELFVYQTGAFGSVNRRLGSPADWPKAISIPANVHAHATWSFTAPGTYRITTTHAATLKDGGPVTSRTTLFVQVGPCSAGAAQPSAPLRADQLLPPSALTEGNRGGLGAAPAAVVAGGTVSVAVPGREAGAWLMPVLYPATTQLGWGEVSTDGRVAGVRLPAGLTPGRHALAAYDASGALVGWTPVDVTAPTAPGAPQDAGSDDDRKDPQGSRGDNGDRGDRGDGGDGGDGGPGHRGGRDHGGDEAADRDDPSEDAGPGASGGTGLPGPGSSAPSGTPGGAGPTSRTCLPAPGAGSSTTPGETGGSSGDDPADDPAHDGSTGSPVSTGHFDFGSQIVDGRLVPKVKDDRTQPPTWVDPGSVRFVLGAAAEQQVPDDPAYAFMGDPGDSVWMVPQTQVDGIPWLGWNTQDESVRSSVDGSVRFTLDEVDGPGELAIYLTDSFGGIGERSLGTVAGFPSSLSVPLNVHAHGNWVFTEAGSYAVTITQSATLDSGEEVSGRATLTFTVGGTAGRLVPGARADQSAVPAPQALAVTRPVLAGRAAAVALPAARAVGAPAAPAGECVLPDTGADDGLAVLLPLGATLVTLGLVVLVAPYRRRATRSVGA